MILDGNKVASEILNQSSEEVIIVEVSSSEVDSSFGLVPQPTKGKVTIPERPRTTAAWPETLIKLRLFLFMI